jgi:plastocyanin
MIRSAAVLSLVGAALLVTAFLSAPRSSIAALGLITVEITDSGYSPATLAIPPHTTVTWTNRGTVDHAVTGDSGRPDSPTLEPHYAYSYTFHNEGTFTYHDGLHPELTGTVAVTVGAPPPTPAPTPEPTPTPAPAPAPSATEETPISTPKPAPIMVATAASESRAVEEPLAPDAAFASAPALAIDVGTEWFGDASFQNGVLETSANVGDTVQWSVVDGIHNVYECGESWSAVNTSCASAAWHSDQVLTSGSTFAYTFDTAGTYYYLCTIHPQTMRGKVVVEADDDPAPVEIPQPAADDSADPGSAVGGAADDAASNPGPVVAGEAALPNGGGAPPVGGGMQTTPFFVAAAVAFAASGLIFWRWKQVSTER